MVKEPGAMKSNLFNKGEEGLPTMKLIEEFLEAEGDDEDKINKLRNILKSAQQKYQAMVAKRDALHEESNEFKAERNRLNRKKNSLVEEMKTLKAKRDELVTKMRKHKAQRNEHQARAKALIKSKSDKSKEVFNDLPDNISIAETELEKLDMQYQTTSLTLEQENALLDNIRAKYKKLDGLKNLEPKQHNLLDEIDDIDGKITELFRLGDEEHNEVVRLSEESQKYHDRMQKYVDEISNLITEANNKHEEFTKINDRATYYHERALEMRTQIVAIRRMLRARAADAKKNIEEQNIAVREALEDDDKLDETIDNALDKLKNTGKIEM